MSHHAFFDQKAATLQTVNNTEVAIITFTPPPGTTQCVKVFANAIGQTSGDGGCWETSTTFTTTGGGTVRRVHNTTNIVRNRDDATWTIGVDINGGATEVEIKTKGDSTEDVEWVVFVHIFENTP